MKEYLRKTKPHLDSEDINLIMEDYKVDEDLDEQKDIRRKKLAYKEAVASAKQDLENKKTKYYAEIKNRSFAPIRFNSYFSVENFYKVFCYI